MAAASEELNGAGTPGGGVGRELRRRIGPENAESEEPYLLSRGVPFFLLCFVLLPFRVYAVQ